MWKFCEKVENQLMLLSKFQYRRLKKQQKNKNLVVFESHCSFKISTFCKFVRACSSILFILFKCSGSSTMIIYIIASLDQCLFGILVCTVVFKKQKHFLACSILFWMPPFSLPTAHPLHLSLWIIARCIFCLISFLFPSGIFHICKEILLAKHHTRISVVLIRIHITS